MSVYIDECRAAGLDPKAVASIAARLDRAAKDAHRLGLMVFGGSGSGSLRTIETDDRSRHLIVADMDGGTWDGGDGGASYGEDGLLRGEGL